jgi:hypothetical protein
MIKQVRIAAWSAMLLCSYIAGSANADTVTYSGHFSNFPISSAGAFPGTGMAMECSSLLNCSISGGDVETVTLQQFDPSLGPLNSLEFTLTSALAHEPPGFQYQTLSIYLADTTNSNEALATVVETLLVTGDLTGDLFSAEFTLENGCTQNASVCSVSAGNPAAQFTGSFNDIAASAALASYIGVGTFEMSFVQSAVFSLMASNINNPSSNYPYMASTFQGGWTGDLSVTYEYNVSPVPLPGAVLLFASSLLGLIGFGRRRKAVIP